VDDVPPRNGCPRVDGVLRVPSAGRWQPRWRREPVPSPGLLPPDEEYGRDGRTRCAAEIRSATNTLAQTSMIIRCFKTETSALLTPRAARRHGRCVRDAYRARAAASVVTPRRSPTYSSAQKAKPSTRNETRLSATMDQAPTGRDHDPTKKGEHLEDPMMVTMDAKARAAQEAELKALFAGARSARSEATEATPEAKDEGAAEAKE
jgi:hypothetical protein